MLVAALVVGCGAVDLAAPHPPHGDEVEAVAWLQASQAAGLQRHDLTAYLSVWAPEATLTIARGPEPGPHERTLDYQALVATRSERFFAPPVGSPRLRWSEVRAARVGDRLVLTWTAHSETNDGGERVGERFELRRSRAGEPRGWRVVHNRLWPLWQIDARRLPVAFDAATWAELDRRAEERACDGLPCPQALLAAWRFAEAHDAARRWTEQAVATGTAAAERWVWRGVSALVSGRVADAAPSFACALAFDAAVPLPPWRSAAVARAGDAASGCGVGR